MVTPIDGQDLRSAAGRRGRLGATVGRPKPRVRSTLGEAWAHAQNIG